MTSTHRASPRSPVSTVTMTRQRVDELEFEVRRSTPVHGFARTFVLLHGLGMSHRSLARLHATLSSGGEVLTITLPGFGGLPRPNRATTIVEMATALGDVLDQINVRSAVVIGQSMGSQWAVELALQRPDLVSHVVAIGPVADDERRSMAAQMLALGADSLRETPRMNALVMADYWRCGPAWYLLQARQMLRYRIEERVGSLGAPLLLVHGSSDRIARRAWCRRLRAATATPSRMVVIPNAPHHAQFFAPRAVAGAIRAFLDAR